MLMKRWQRKKTLYGMGNMLDVVTASSSVVNTFDVLEKRGKQEVTNSLASSLKIMPSYLSDFAASFPLIITRKARPALQIIHLAVNSTETSSPFTAVTPYSHARPLHSYKPSALPLPTLSQSHSASPLQTGSCSPNRCCY